MKPEDVTLSNLAEYTAFLITEFYRGNLEPYLNSLDEDVIWCGALHKQLVHGKKNVLDLFANNPQQITFSIGPIYTEVIPHGSSHCDTLSFFDRDAFYPSESNILWHMCFHLSWVKNDVWQMSIISLSHKDDRDNADEIYQLHPSDFSSFTALNTNRSARLSVKEKYSGNILYLSPLSIEWIEGQGHYSTIYYGDNSVTVTASIRELRDMTEGLLLQCHSGYIVNPLFVKESGRFFLRLSNGKTIPIPEKKYTSVLDGLKRLLDDYRHIKLE